MVTQLAVVCDVAAEKRCSWRADLSNCPTRARQIGERLKMKTIPSNATIVLVHAAWADASSWSAVIGPLLKTGVRVILAGRRVAVLRTQWVLLGRLYGSAVWAVMNLVLPRTAVAPGPIMTAALVNGVIGHALFVGLPSAFFAKKVAV